MAEPSPYYVPPKARLKSPTQEGNDLMNKAGVAPAVAPALIEDLPEGPVSNAGPNPENVIQYAAMAKEARLAAILGPNYKTQYNEQQIQELQGDTPTWRAQYQKAIERTREQGKAIRANPDSPQYSVLNNNDALMTLGKGLLAEEATAEKSGGPAERHAFWESKLAFNYVNYVAYMKASENQGGRIRSALIPVMPLFSREGLWEGVKMAARNYDVGEGLSWNRVKGTFVETPQAAGEVYNRKLKQAENGFFGLIKMAKEGKDFDKKKVDRILALNASNPDYFTSGMDGSTQFMKDLYALTPAERAEVLLGLNHEVVLDKKTGKLRPMTAADEPNSGRPMSLLDFDEGLLNDKGLDKTDVVNLQEEQTAYAGLGAPELYGYEFMKLSDKMNKRAARVAAGKVDPAQWFTENKGRGFLEDVPTLASGTFAAGGAVAYNWWVSPIEQKYTTGVYGLYNILASNTRPNSFFWDAKNQFLNIGKNDWDKKIAYHATSMERNKWEEEAFGADGQRGLKMPIADTVIETLFDKEKANQIKQDMRDYGYVTPATAELGFMTLHPAMAASKVAAVGVNVNKAVRTAEYIGLSAAAVNRVEKVVKGVAIANDWLMSGPVKVAGFTAGLGGRAIAYVPAALASPLAKVGGRVLYHMGAIDDPAKAVAAAKRGLLMMGFTDTFLMGDWSKKMAFVWGFGKGAEGAGHLLGKYLDWRLDGYGFRGAMHAAANDSTISALARATARRLSEGGIFTKWAWDTAKGMYGGAGVMYSIGVMKGDHLDAMQSISTGLGMGGLNAGLHGGHAYFKGQTQHAQAKKMLEIEANSPNFDPVTRATLLERLDKAEREGDYEFAPRLVSAVERTTKLGVGIVVATTEALKNNANLRAADIVALPDTDMTVTYDGQTRTFDVKKLHAEVEALRVKIKAAEAVNDAVEVNRLGELLGDAQRRRFTEINEYLDAVRRSGNNDLKERVGNSQTFAGVYHTDIDGARTIYLNLNEMDSTTGSHEVFHGLQKLIGLTQASRTFNQFAFGIKFGTVDENGNRGETVFEKGLFDAEDIRNAGTIYITRFGGDAATRSRRLAELNAAVDEMKSLQGKGLLSESSHRTIERLGEEMGARWYENFISRKPQDYLYFGGKYGKMRQLSDKMVLYFRHNSVIDANAAGIKSRIGMTADKLRAIENKRQTLDRYKKVYESVRKEVEDAIEAMRQSGKSDADIAKDIQAVPNLKRKLEFVQDWDAKTEFYNDMSDAVAASTEHGMINDMFRDADGNNLVVKEVDKYFESISGLEGNTPLSISLNLNEMSGLTLEGHLSAMGLEHYGYRDSSGVMRLKDRKVIEQEEAARGKRTEEILVNLPSTRSGVVRTVDKNGNVRYVGALSDEALTLLTNDEFDLNGTKHRTLPAGVAIKMKTMRDAVLSTIDPNNTDFNVYQFLYSGLSKEVEGGPRVRKPHGTVEQTFRRVLPYRMELVATTKDRNGNKIPAVFEMMVTAIDLNVIYGRMANEYNATYTLPSGKVVQVKDMFGGDMAIMHSYFKRYLTELSRNNPRPTAETFGGGEIGEAIRDVMYRVLGTIPEGGHDFTGKPLAYNNPIIKPFEAWERGPDFAFTTFRVDLMSHVEQIADRISFNDAGYGKALGNYQPPKQVKRVPLNEGRSFLHTYEGDFEPNSVKNRQDEGAVNKASYNVLESDGKFIVSSEQLLRPMTFSTLKSAEDYIHMDYQRASILINSGAVLNQWNLKGVAVGSTGDGKYMLIDNFSFNKKVSPTLNKAVNEMTFSTFAEAFKAAANVHNKMALESLDKSKGLSKEQKELTRFLVTSGAVTAGAEAFPLRVEIGNNGEPLLEPKTKLEEGETVPDLYTDKDIEVKKGLAQVGQQKMQVSFQKMDYNWLKSLTGDANLKANDPLIKSHGRTLGRHLAKEMVKFINDPEILAGYRWYLDFSERGHKVFGNMFPVMCEALGATSARTPVKTNFEQATEFMRKFSLGQYDDKIKVIVGRLEQLHAAINLEAPSGERNEFTKTLIRHLVYKSKLGDTEWRRQNGIPDVTLKNFTDNPALLPDTIRMVLEKEVETRMSKKDYKPTDKQRKDYILEQEKNILSQADTVLLREGDKKFNMNSEKVTMVAVAHFLQKSDGPKTIQFSQNLMGTDLNATIDVWAARTISRLVHSKMLKSKMWRIRPSMENAVDGEVIRSGTKNMPIVTGKGDFYLGQEAFRVATDILKRTHGLTMKEFADLTPANLQAMLWFAEKKVWDSNGWTGEIGAEMSSFDAPLKRMTGEADPSGVLDTTAVRRFLFGVSGTVDAARVIGYRLNAEGKTEPITVNAGYRRFPTPVELLKNMAAEIRRQFGDKTVSLQVDQTIGGYGYGMEDSIYLSASMERGLQITLGNDIAKNENDIRNAENNIIKKHGKKATASAEEAAKLESEIESLRKDIAESKSEIERLNGLKTGDASTPDALNQLPTMLDRVIALGKQYQQSDVLAHEVVGPKHPNARPMRTIKFDVPIDGEMATYFIESMNKKEAKPSYGGVFAFTMEPDARLTNRAKIENLSKQVEALEKESRGSSDLKRRHELDGQISNLRRQILKEQKFTSMYAVSVPEFAWRFGNGSKKYTEHIETLTVDWAAQEMDNWSKGFDEAYAFTLAQFEKDKKSTSSKHGRWEGRKTKVEEQNALNKKKKGYVPKKVADEPIVWNMNIAALHKEHVSTYAVADAGYDYFDVSSVSNQTTLKQNLDRYGQEILRGERNIDESVGHQNDARNPDEAVRNNPSGVRVQTEGTDVQRSGHDAGGRDVQGQAVSAKTKRLTQSEALKWLRDRESKSAESEAGFLYGDADISMLVVKGPDGRPTNEVRVMERGLPVAKFNSLAEAQGYVTGRLTGEAEARSIPEALKINGKKFDVRAGVRALSNLDAPSNFGEREGSYDPWDSIFGYDMFQPTKGGTEGEPNPIDGFRWPKTPKNFRRLDKGRKPVVTPDQDRRYLEAIAEGDMDLAKQLFNEVRAKSDYVSAPVYRGTKVKNMERKTLQNRNNDTSTTVAWAFRDRAKAKAWGEARVSDNADAEVLSMFNRTKGVQKGGNNSEWGASSGPDGYFDISNKDHQALLATSVEGLRDSILTAAYQYPENSSQRKRYEYAAETIQREYEQIKAGRRNFINFEAASILTDMKEFPELKDRNWLQKTLADEGFIGHLESEGAGVARDASQLESRATYRTNDLKLNEFVTYDDNGNVIPLSQRFDPTNPDIRYQPARFRPKVPKYVFGSESTNEKKMLAFPNYESLAKATGDRDSIISQINTNDTPLIVYDPSEAYSGRVTMHLTEMQKVMDEYTDAVGLPKCKVFFYIQNSNTADSPYIGMGRIGVGVVAEAEWNGTVNGVAKNYGDKPFRIMPQRVTAHNSAFKMQIPEDLALTDLQVRYHANTSDGYLSYADAITRYSTRNGPSISYAEPVRQWQRMIKRATGSSLDPAQFIPTAEVQAKMEDIIANVGGLGYAELSARLYAVGTGTKYDSSGRQTIGLKGDVVNTSGSLMSARIRGMGQGNTESSNWSYQGLNLSLTAVARRIEEVRIEREKGGTMTPIDRFRFKQAIADAEAYSAHGGVSRGGTNSQEVVRLRAFVQAYDPAKVSHFENFFNRIDQIYTPTSTNPDVLVPPAVGDLTLRRVKSNKSHDPYVVTDPQDVFYETVAKTKQGFLTMRPHGTMETHSWISENEAYQPIKWKLIDAQRKGGIPAGEKQFVVKGQRGYTLNLTSMQYSNDRDHKSVTFNRKDRDILVRQVGAFMFKAKVGTEKFNLLEARIKALEEHHGKPFNEIYEKALDVWHKHNGSHGQGTTGLDGNLNSNSHFWTTLFMSDFSDALAPLIEFDKKAFEEGKKLDPDILLGEHEFGFGDMSRAANGPSVANKFRPYEILRAFFGGKAGDGMGVFEKGEHRTSFGGFPIANNRFDSIQTITKGSHVLKAYVHDALIKGGMERNEAAFQIRRLMDALKFLTYENHSQSAERQKAENELIINSVLSSVGLGKLAKSIVSQGNLALNAESYQFGGRLYSRELSVTDFDPHARPDQDSDSVQALIMQAAKEAGLSDDTIGQAVALLRNGRGSNLNDAIVESSDSNGYADRDMLEAKKKMYEKGSEVDAEIDKILNAYGISRSHVQQGIHSTTPTRSAKALIDAVQRQIDTLSDMKAAAERNGYGIVEGLEGQGYETAEIQQILGDTYSPSDATLATGQEAKQKKMVDKEMARLKKLRAQALAEYTGAEGGKVSMKRKSLETTLADGLKSGEIKDVGTLFATLRSFGVKRVSAKDIMRYVQMTPDGQDTIPSDAATEALVFMNQGLAGTEAHKPESQLKIPLAITESKDFQLLMFLDALSGLEAEADPNMASVVDPATRAWAKGRGQFNVSSDKGRYGYRTDGDMRTILEEHHHFLLQQNKSYRRIYDAMRVDTNSGKDFKDRFDSVMKEEHKTLDDMMASFERGDLEATFRLMEGLTASHTSALTNNPAHSAASRAKVGERVASAYVGGKAILLLGQLWMNALGTNQRNFAFGETGVKSLIRQKLAKNEQGLASSGTEASAADLMFNTKFTPSASKAGSDPSMISMDRFYYAGMEGDYGMKNLVEFAAHALNDHNVQGILSRMKPVVMADGREPMQAAVDALRSSKNQTFKGYGERLYKVISSAKNLLEQLVAVIKVMAGFRQTGNHSSQGTDWSREQTRKNTSKALGERTALEQAIEASTLVHPRHKGQHRPTDAGLAEAEQKGMTDVGTVFEKRKRTEYDATSGDFKEDQILKYLGRVNQVKPVPKK